MDEISKPPSNKTSGIKDESLEEIIFNIGPYFLLHFFRRYFRLEIFGQEYLPQKGSALLFANHSGFSGLDAMILSREILEITQRLPKTLTHPLWFSHPKIGSFVERFGYIKASYKNGLQTLKNEDLLIVFPEGEEGNFKPSSRAYTLQKFKPGFIKMALRSHSPLIPCVILGAEETHITLRQLRLSKYLHNLMLPLPLNLFPLPAKWSIHFFEPIFLPYTKEAASDSELIDSIADDLREKLQLALNTELQKRNQKNP